MDNELTKPLWRHHMTGDSFAQEWPGRGAWGRKQFTQEGPGRGAWGRKEFTQEGPGRGAWSRKEFMQGWGEGPRGGGPRRRRHQGPPGWLFAKGRRHGPLGPEDLEKIEDLI